MSPTLFQHLPRHFVYRHIRKDNNLPFYIGIGTQNVKDKPYQRAYDKSDRNPHWKNVAQKCGYSVEIFYESNNEREIQEKEIEFIKLYGRADLDNGILTNKRDGGDKGGRPSPEEIEALKIRNKTNRYNKGKKFSLETRVKMSFAKKGNDNFGNKKGSYKVPVIQYDRYGRKIAEFKSIKEAADSIGKNKSMVSACARVGKQICGFYFRYKK